MARPARSATIVVAGAVLLSGSLIAPAGADDEIVIRPETVIYGKPGSVHNVSSEQVPVDPVGKPCDLRIKTQNNSSIHPGTTAIVTTGSSRTVVPGIEESSNALLLSTTRVELGHDIVIEVQLGRDGGTSLGFTAGFECSPESLMPPPVLPAKQLAPPISEPPTTAPVTTATTAPATTAPTAPPTSTRTPSALPALQTRTDLPQTPPAKSAVRTPNFTG